MPTIFSYCGRCKAPIGGFAPFTKRFGRVCFGCHKALTCPTCHKEL